MNEICTIDIRYSESLAMRKIFKELRYKLKINQSDLARAYKCEPPTISNYLNGKITLNMQFALFFAEKMNVQLREFSPRLDREYNELAESHKKVAGYPLIQHENIQGFLNSTYQQKEKYISSPVPCSNSSFWVEIGDHAMEGLKLPYFASYIKILVDPEIKPKVNEFALFMMNLSIPHKTKKISKDQNKVQFIFRQLIDDGSEIVATCNDEQFKNIPIQSKNMTLIGKVVSAHYPSSIFNA